MATSSSSVGFKIPTHNVKTVLLENLLKCPVCGSDFSLKPDNILCAKNHSFPHRGNVIDFSSVDKIDHLQTRSQESFGVEWTQYYANLGWSPKELPVETEMFLTYTRAMPNFFRAAPFQRNQVKNAAFKTEIETGAPRKIDEEIPVRLAILDDPAEDWTSFSGHNRKTELAD